MPGGVCGFGWDRACRRTGCADPVAVGLAIDRFRRCEHVSYDPQGMHEFVVESRQPSTQH
jgi:hypothetical protein